MMPRALAIIFLMGFGFSARGADHPCEATMSTSALRYLRTLKSAVRIGDVTSENLQWLMKQSQPVDPIVAPRSERNLSFKQKLRREIPNITSAQWKFVLQEVKVIGSETLAKDEKIVDGKETTKNIWAIFPIDFKFPPSERVLTRFTSTLGENFIVTHGGRDLIVYNINAGTKIVAKDQKPHLGVRSIDIFERSSGELILAVISSDCGTVLNARTGVVIGNVTARSVENFQPLLFDAKGVLSLSLGMREDMEERDSHVSQFIVSFPVGKKPIYSSTSFRHVVRLKDGHLYGRLLLKSSDEIAVEVRDLTTEIKASDLMFRREKNVDVHSALIFNHGPRLLLRRDGESQWEAYDPKTKGLEPTNLNHDRGANLSSLVHVDDEAINISTVEANGVVGMEIAKVFSEEMEPVILPFAPDSTYFTRFDDPRLIHTRNALWIYDWEYSSNRIVKLHLFNLRTKELISLPTGRSFQFQPIIFYNSVDDTIQFPATTDGLRWQLYSVFGPERIRP